MQCGFVNESYQFHGERRPLSILFLIFHGPITLRQEPFTLPPQKRLEKQAAKWQC